MSKIKLLSLVVLLAFLFSLPHVFGKEENTNITFTQEQIMEIKQLISQQQQQIQEEASSRSYWYSQYKTLKQCIRTSEDHGQALLCTGDTYANSEKK